MLASKLVCPHCSAVLKSAREVPAGVRITCPQCKKGFTSGIQRTEVREGPPSIRESLPVPTPPSPKSPPPSPSIQTPSVSVGKRGALVIGGLGLLVVIGGTLLAIFLGSGGTTREPGSDDLVLSPPSGGTRPAKAKPLIELTPDEEKEVQAMTDKGVEWLRKNQRADGTWAPYKGHHGAWPDGVTAMCGLTLLSCGVDAKDPAVQKATERIRSMGPKLNRTYEIALAILFLDKLGDPADARLMETLAFRLIAGQTDRGGWSYHCPMHNESDQQAVWQALGQLQEKQASFLQSRASPTQEKEAEKIMQGVPGHLRGIGAFSKPPASGGDFFRHGGDNSNTQFAALALWAARKHAIPVDRSLQLTVLRFKSSQNKDGSWFYGPNNNVIPQPTMTCAGLLALAVEYGVRDKDDLKGSRPEDNPNIKSALEHVAKSLNPPKGEKAKADYPPLYFIWSVERVGMLFQLKTIAGKDWYRWGLRILSDHQRPDGHWYQGWNASTDVVDTCFALLFLNRVNLSADLTDKLTEFGLGSSVSPPPPARKD